MTTTERTGRHRAARSRRRVVSKGAALAALALTALPVGIILVLTGPMEDGFSSRAPSPSGSTTTLPRPDAESSSSRPVAPPQPLKPTPPPLAAILQDRKSVLLGKWAAGSVDRGGARIIKK